MNQKNKHMIEITNWIYIAGDQKVMLNFEKSNDKRLRDVKKKLK